MTQYLRKKGSLPSVNIAAGQGTSMQVLIGAQDAPNFAMRIFTMEPDGGMPMHTNLVEHEQFVVSGSATVTIGEETFEVAAGDSIYIPAQIPHSYRAGPEGFQFICVVPNKRDEVVVVG